MARHAELDKEIEALATTAPYREPVGWLRCFRGIDTLSAMILLAEVVDFQRFERPRELMADLGLVPSEGQVRALLDNFDGDALGMWRTAGRVRSA